MQSTRMDLSFGEMHWPSRKPLIIIPTYVTLSYDCRQSIPLPSLRVPARPFPCLRVPARPSSLTFAYVQPVHDQRWIPGQGSCASQT